MIEFFANTVVDHLKSVLGNEYKITISPDSENAICFESEDTYYYWKLSANLETNNFELHEVILDKSLDLKSDTTYNHSIVLDSINHMIEYIIQH